MERQRKPIRKPDESAEPSGEPEEMKALGESFSGTQPEIGHKDTGVGRRVKEGAREEEK